jgi:hypothetical protein
MAVPRFVDADVRIGSAACGGKQAARRVAFAVRQGTAISGYATDNRMGWSLEEAGEPLAEHYLLWTGTAPYIRFSVGHPVFGSPARQTINRQTGQSMCAPERRRG